MEPEDDDFSGTGATPSGGHGMDMEITPQDIGAILSNPNMTPEDRKKYGDLSTTIADVQQFVKDNKIKARGLPRGSAASELALRSHLADPENQTTVEQVTQAVKDYRQNSHMGVSPGIALDIVKHIKPQRAIELSKIHSDPLFQNHMADAKDIIRGSQATGDTGNGAVNAKVIAYQNHIYTTLQDAIARHENIKPYIDESLHDPKYLFTPENAYQYRPTKEELKNNMVLRPPSEQAVRDSQFLKARPTPTTPDGAPVGSIFDFMKTIRGQ